VRRAAYNSGLLFAASDRREGYLMLSGEGAKDKAARYEHLGMKLDRVRNCGEKFHMYDLIRE